MILKALIHKIISYIHQHPDEHGSRFLLHCAKHNGKDLTSYMNGLPAYAFIEVRDYVPKAFPKKLRHGHLVARKNTLGAWKIDPAEEVLGTTKPIS